MKNKVFAVLLATVATSSLLLVNCNNPSCDYVSKCPNDQPLTQDQITTCNNEKDDKCCGGLYNDYLACMQDHQTCTSSGVTDTTVTNGTCGDPYAKWQDCYYGTDTNGCNRDQ